MLLVLIDYVFGLCRKNDYFLLKILWKDGFSGPSKRHLLIVVVSEQGCRLAKSCTIETDGPPKYK